MNGEYTPMKCYLLACVQYSTWLNSKLWLASHGETAQFPIKYCMQR